MVVVVVILILNSVELLVGEVCEEFRDCFINMICLEIVLNWYLYIWLCYVYLSMIISWIKMGDIGMKGCLVGLDEIVGIRSLEERF